MYFNCGMVGHPEKFCKNEKLDLGDSPPLRPCIRSNIYGRRFIDPKERKHFSIPTMAKNYGYSSPTAPDELLQQLSELKLQEDREQQDNTNYLKRPMSHLPLTQ